MKEQKICKRCIMDTTAPGIWFDENGVCNFCKIHDTAQKDHPTDKDSEVKLNSLLEKIKNNGRGKKYDCIVGVSGGRDSTYTLYLTKKLGLRPLAVHCDNGWNSELSVTNIKKITEKLDVDLYTEVLDWEEFKDLQRAFLRASVPDADIPADMAINSVLFKAASKEKLKYIIWGKTLTQGKCPIGWSYGDHDLKYIKSLHKKFGNVKMDKFPRFSITDLIYFQFFKKIKSVTLFNYIEYNKDDVTKLLKNELGWREYKEKHYENLYTIFIQSYYLPKKFKIDKRKLHYSALIRYGNMTREEALNKTKENVYPEEELVSYVISKLDISKEEFNEIMRSPPKTFMEYSNSFWLEKLLVKTAIKMGFLEKKFSFFEWDRLKGNWFLSQ